MNLDAFYTLFVLFDSFACHNLHSIKFEINGIIQLFLIFNKLFIVHVFSKGVGQS